jgi:ribosomal protein L35AE/L33A
MTLEKVIDTIYKLNNEDLNTVIDAIKLRRNQIHTQQAQTFKVGDTVSFKGRYGRTETGTVTKVKIKNVVVDTGSVRWNVPGNLLTKGRKVA